VARYISKRLWQSLISLFILSIIIFALARVSGNPIYLLLPTSASEETKQILTKEYGLDRPYVIQYYEFLSHMVRGDLGTSIRYGRPATQLYFERLPNTIRLVGAGVFLAVIISLLLGIISGSRRGTWLDQAIKAFTVIGIAAPGFWLALLLINIFSVRLGLLPAARTGGIDHYILPAFSMCLMSLAAMVRILRSSIIEVNDSEFVKLARIKGVSENVLLWKHSLRNSLITFITFLGSFIAMMLSGSVVIELVFAWPGCGRLAYEGILARDYPLVQTVVMIHGVIIVLMNLLVDIVYSYIDPRIRIQ
jgi:peptide/nickel transport system permease protein